MAWWDEVKARYRPAGPNGVVSPTDEEIIEILEDPDVSDETKRELIAAWSYDYATGYIPGDIFAQERTGYDQDNVPQEVQDYIEEYDAQEYVDAYATNAIQGDAVNNAIGDFASLATGEGPGPLPMASNPSAFMQAVIERAEDERRYADNAEEQQENTQALEAYAGRLKATGTTGAVSSAEIFDSGEVGLDFFRLFWGDYGRYVHGMNRTASRDTDGNRSPVNLTGAWPVDVWIFKARYNEQREVEFARIGHEVDRYALAVDHLELRLEELTKVRTDLFGTWEGEAADAAALTYDAAVDKIRTLMQELDGTRKVLIEVRGTLEQMCLTKAQTVNGLYTSTIGGVGPNVVGRLVTVAKGGGSEDDILFVAAQFGIEATQECLSTTDDAKAEIQRAAAEWCDGNLVPVVETTLEAFWDVCDATDEGFEEVLGAMRDMLGQGPAVGSARGGSREAHAR